MAFNKGDRGDAPMKRRMGRRRKKVCVFCSTKEPKVIDYKDVNIVTKYDITVIICPPVILFRFKVYN